ncbi:NRDE family protein [Aliikangiella coralliicola]|uniref:NRDE family protein n=1 Tax=Aliikangiella coralliicola TaxID=2592383 RepID=A0A545U8K5_9GAMM|nr:NRDE family protein [Aliikangiella coralliicola]TQV85799.1 NRDE family protein [Aliikangiella coralliicola]
MCILFTAIRQHPQFPLIICANRDESHSRPTRLASFWPDRPYLLAGKDLQAGGSWFGVNNGGEFAAVTNIRNGQAQDPDKRSRGDLITLALEPDSPINQTWLAEHGHTFNPFNLIYGNHKTLYCFNSVTQTHTFLDSGFHSVSNGAIDDIWPKMAKGTCQLKSLVEKSDKLDSTEQIPFDQLFEILKDQSKPETNLLPDTGIPLEWEKRLSSIFITGKEYGTRSSTLVLIDTNNKLTFVERSFTPEGTVEKESHFLFEF